MEPLIIHQSDDTPKVVFDINKDFFEISSRSLPENAVLFYTPLMDWLTTYSSSPSENTNVIFHFEYISTSSTKQVLKLILILDQLSKTRKVTVNWNYDKGDADMMETGERLEKLMSSLKFTYNEV